MSVDKQYSNSVSISVKSKQGMMLRNSSRNDTIEQYRSSVSVASEKIRDAETGEFLSITLAKWDADDGLLSMSDAQSIIDMGKKRYSIVNTQIPEQLIKTANCQGEAVEPTIAGSSITTLPSLKTEEMEYGERSERMRKLMRKFHLNGPLNSRFHKNWDPKTDLPNDRACKSMKQSSSSQQMNSSHSIRRGGDTAKNSSSAGSLISAPSSTNRSEVHAMVGAEDWAALEERYYRELFSLASGLEANKRQTREELNRGGHERIVKLCRELARYKTQHSQRIAAVIAREEEKEKSRELEVQEVTSIIGRIRMRREHDEERSRCRLYLRTLNHDFEIIFSTKLRDLGWLW